MPEASPPPVEKPPPARSGWSLRGIFRRARSEPDAGPSPPPGAPRLLVDAPKRVMLARLPSRYIVDDAGALSPKISGKNTFGLVRFTVHEAALEAAAKGRDYFCVVSVGAQSWATREARARAPGAAAALAFDAGSEFVLQREGASLVRVALFRQGALDGARRSRLEGWAEVDLAQFLQDAPAAVGAAPAGPRDFFGAAEAEEAGGARGAGGANGAQGAADADAGAAHTGDPIEGAAAAAAAAAGLTFEGEFPLVDPSDPARRVGSVRLSARASGLAALERRVWGELLSLADFAGDGALSPPELGALLRAFGSNLPEEELAALFGAADANGDGRVDVEELAALLSARRPGGDSADAGFFHALVRRCPVDGAELSPDPADAAANLLYVYLALAAAREPPPGEGELRGGFSTAAQAARSWQLSLSEWASLPLGRRRASSASNGGQSDSSARRRSGRYRAGGLRVGAAASHVLVYDRARKMVVEERIAPVLMLAMRKLYQSRAGRLALRQGLASRLTAMSAREGRYRDSAESAKDIAPFVESFRGEIDVAEAERPLSEYGTFNEFFYRRLRPGARPVAAPADGDVLVSAADCRLMAFEEATEAARFWVKGRNFSVAGLLADTDPERPLAARFDGGALAIFRLAPQDYHRWHTPVAGRVVSIADVPGGLLTVNPVAVNSPLHDVFTENKRSVALLESPGLGLVAVVAVGATLVGSIVWTVAVGDELDKGGEMGHFAFGGSTVVALFEPGAAAWDADLLANSRRSLETLVRVGERVGARGGSAAAGVAGVAGVAGEAAAAAAAAADVAGVVALEERPFEARMLSGESSGALASVLEAPEAAAAESGESGGE